MPTCQSGRILSYEFVCVICDNIRNTCLWQVVALLLHEHSSGLFVIRMATRSLYRPSQLEVVLIIRRVGYKNRFLKAIMRTEKRTLRDSSCNRP